MKRYDNDVIALVNAVSGNYEVLDESQQKTAVHFVIQWYVLIKQERMGQSQRLHRLYAYT